MTYEKCIKSVLNKIKRVARFLIEATIDGLGIFSGAIIGGLAGNYMQDGTLSNEIIFGLLILSVILQLIKNLVEKQYKINIITKEERLEKIEEEIKAINENS
jgi:hypothetical protein